MDWVTALSFLFGASFGSFVNVCVYRLPRRLSIVSPPSHCPHCGTPLKPLDLVPLLSFLWLFGKCRYCKTPISWRYFFVELVTGLFFVLSVHRYGVNLESLFVAVSLSVLLIIAIVDWQFFLVPDEAVWALGLFGVARQIFRLPVLEGVWQSLGGAFVAGGAIFLIGVMGRVLFQKEAMGFGDVKIAAAIGSHLGLFFPFLMACFLISVFSGLFIGLFWSLWRRKSLRGYIPFGPALALAAMLMLLYPWETVHTLSAFFDFLTQKVIQLIG